MNKFIKEQLNKCRVKLPEWNDNTTEIIISNNNESSVVVNSGTIHIMIENYIINEPNTFTLSKDWNNNTVPPEHEMFVEILDKRGKMTRVKGVGINSNTPWEGWLPEKGFRII